jgi:hypothetical protein
MKILTSNPSDSDSILLRTTLYSSDTPLLEIDYNVVDNGDSINVEGCYSTGLANAGDSLIHDFNLGLKSAGQYKIYFTLYGTPYWDSCTYFFIEKDSILLNIGYSSLSDLHDSELNIYPNPLTNGFINIQSNLSYEAYQIYNSLGQLVQEGKLEPKIDIDLLQKGLYYFILQNETNLVSQKLIVE